MKKIVPVTVGVILIIGFVLMGYSFMHQSFGKIIEDTSVKKSDGTILTTNGANPLFAISSLIVIVSILSLVLLVMNKNKPTDKKLSDKLPQ